MQEAEEENVETPLLEREHDERSAERERNKPMWKLIFSPFIDVANSSYGVLAGLLMLALAGTAFGLILPQNEKLPSAWYRTFSNVIGYWCFFCWSVSFYPQIFSNFSRKTTKGLSSDYCSLNVIGFACYSVYNIMLFYSPEIQELYRKRNHGSENTGVEGNDVAFAVHAFVISLITFFQIGYYDGISALKPKRIIGLIMIGILLSISTYGFLIMTFNKNPTSTHLSSLFTNSNWLDFLYFLSYIKLFISLIKYIPQVILNYSRKSTTGWSIWNILLDFSGGVLNDLQLILDCAAMGDWTGLTGNLGKFGLGSISIVFDIIFLIQHYVLYPSSGSSNETATSSVNNNSVDGSENNEEFQDDT